MTRIFEQALSMWNAKPFLQRVFVDYQHFAESYAVAHGENDDAPAKAIASLLAYYDGQIAEAGVRLERARRPMTHKTGNGLSFVDRIGTHRLGVWLYGAVAMQPSGIGTRQIAELTEVLNSQTGISAITMRIDSLGGSAAIAETIAWRLRRHPARKIAIIDGACGSAANWFAAIADRVFMRKSATWFTHHSHRWAGGDESALRAAAYQLRGHDQGLARAMCTYRRITPEAFRRLQDEARFIGAEEALSLGLIDQIIPDLPPTIDVPANLTLTGAPTMFDHEPKAKDFKRAKAELDAADKKVAQLQQRRTELDASIVASRERLNAKTLELDAVVTGAVTLAEAEQQTRRIADDQSKEQTWLDQQLRMRAALETELGSAKVAAWQAENAARQAQGDAHAAQYEKAEREFLQLVREPLRKLVAKAHLAGYFGALPMQGESGAHRYAVSNAGVLWSGALEKRIRDIAAEPDFHAFVGKADSGTAPASPVASVSISAAERSAAWEASRAPSNRDSGVRAALAGPTKAEEPNAPADSRYNPSTEMQFWKDKVSSFERRIKEATAQPETPRRAAILEDLKQQLEQARTRVAAWAEKAAPKAA